MVVRLKHNDYILKTQKGHRLVRPCGYKVDLTYDLLDYDRYEKTPQNIARCIQEIEQNLSQKFVSADFKKKYPSFDESHRFRGLCVLATMVLLYLIDSEDLNPMSALDDDGMRHWWVWDFITDEVYDITGGQYKKKVLRMIHERGKITPYYGWGQRPAARFVDFLQLLQPLSLRTHTDHSPFKQ